MTDIYEICKKLKPLLGQQAENYWLAYLSADAEEKKEIADAIQLLAVQLLGLDFDNTKIHLSVPGEPIAEGEYPIGSVLYAKKSLYPFGIRESEWLQHISIFGRSGSGKTNTVIQLIKNLLSHNKPFLIFDWKRNYRDLLTFQDKKMFVYTVGGSVSPFAFNPLIPPKDVDPDIWLKKLIEIICSAQYLGDGVKFLLQEAIHAVYKKFGIYKGKSEPYPTFTDVLDWLENQPVKGRKGLWMDSALRGIKSICFGPMGKVVNTSVQSNLAELLEQNVVLELDRLTNADKALIIESMLLWIHHYRMGQKDRETFKHALIIEEAHHILTKRTGGQGGESITETVLREIRELGEAIVLVDQHPSLISPVALGNTYATICLNLKHRSDVNAMGSAMLLDNDEREILGSLPIGHAVVKLQGRWQQPFQITIPHQKINKGEVTDDKLSTFMQKSKAPDVLGLGKTHDSSDMDKKVELSEKEETFLLDVLCHPFSGIVERYRRLLLSRRKGNTIKENCLDKELLEPVEVSTRTGRVVLLILTKLSAKLLKERGYEFNNTIPKEYLNHEFWKHKAADYYSILGYEVFIEKRVNGYTDLVIEKDGTKAAVEIETGKSDWRKNVQKNLEAGYQTIFIFATNEKAFSKIQKAIVEENLNLYVEIYKAQDIL
jgi:hypothetical protein